MRKTKVIFLLERDSENQVWAYFPETGYKRHFASGQSLMIYDCYASVGQHSTCNQDYINGCKYATPDQYAELKKELQRIGYELNDITPGTKSTSIVTQSF